MAYLGFEFSTIGTKVSSGSGGGDSGAAQARGAIGRAKARSAARQVEAQAAQATVAARQAGLASWLPIVAGVAALGVVVVAIAAVVRKRRSR